MWNLCRPAALQQLQRTRTLLLQTPLRSLRATASAHVAPFSRTFATSSSVAGVEMSRLLESSPSDLEAELGRGKIVEVQQALAKEFTTVIKQEDATSEDLLQLFSAAQKTRLPSVMTRAFDELKDKFPESIDFTMYGEIFRILSRQHEGEKMKEIYEFARPRFEPTVPEIVFRYGIVGNIETGNMEDAQRIADDMERNYQLPLTNEIYSYLIGGYAREKNVKTVLDIYEALDPQVGQWHESAVDRVILSLGIIGKPQLAFEFYVNSNMKLNGGTLITLLSVCRHNDCRQQASDILENRKRFNLRLNARAYNAILETLEYLDRRDEIINILNEMNNDGIRFDTRTKAIVARNQDVLEGTFFDRKSNPNSALKSNKEDKKSKTNKKRTAFVATPELRKLLSEKKFTEAAALADQYVRPMTSEDLPEEERESTSIEEGALHTQASVMKEAIQAFMANGETKKVDGLLKGIELSKNKVGYALIDVLTKYANDKKHNKLAYRAAKLMLAQGWQIHRAGDALQVFRDFNDAEGAHALCMQLLDEFTANQRSKSDGDKSTKKTGNSLSPATVATTFGWTVRILADNNDLPRALALFDKAQESGIRIEPFHYIGILAAMRKHSAHIAKQKGVVVLADNYRTKPFCYMSDDFEAVLDDMEKRGVRMTRGVISNACIALAGGNKRQRLRLLERYAATRDEEVKFDTPTVVYSVLLQVCGKELGDIEEMKKIYDEGVASLAVQADGTKRIPLDWEVVVISHLSDAGQIDDALERLKAMRAKTGTYSYEAAVKVLRDAIVAKHESAVTAAVELMEQREFKPTLSDTYDLVHLARTAKLPYVAFDIIGMYERAHGRTTEDAVDHAKSRQSHRDKYAVRKIRAMYRVVLKMCKQNGEWERALAFSTRVNELLRYETGEDDDDASEDFSSDKQQEGGRCSPLCVS